jgi:hypothetical protein
MVRPFEERPEADRSDWTEQDLLTRAEALPRLREAIEEAAAVYTAEQDSAARREIGARLDAMRGAYERLSSSS